MERAEYDRHSRARVAETAKDASRHPAPLQHRTRRSASTIGGAAPDTIIGRAAADRAGARPYRAMCRRTFKERARVLWQGTKAPTSVGAQLRNMG